MKKIQNFKVFYSLFTFMFSFILFSDTVLANCEIKFMPGEVIVGMKSDFNESAFSNSSDIFPGINILEIENLLDSVEAALPKGFSRTGSINSMKL